MEDNNDTYLKEYLKKELPQAGKDEWFTRKVMNRLPDKKRNYAWIEYVAYAICGIICVCYWAQFVRGLNGSAITVGEILKYFSLLAVSVVLVWQMIRRVVLYD
ncbi:MAG: hypothetical protein RR854_08695 [Muribaculaceae bacterium]